MARKDRGPLVAGAQGAEAAGKERGAGDAADLLCAHWCEHYTSVSSSVTSAALSPELVAALERPWRPLWLWRRGPRAGVHAGLVVEERVVDEVAGGGGGLHPALVVE